MDFRSAVTIKRVSSVSPPGYGNSSEEEQPLDFSRTSREGKKSRTSEPETGSPRAKPNPKDLPPHLLSPAGPGGLLLPGFPATSTPFAGLALNVIQANPGHVGLYAPLAFQALQTGSNGQQPLSTDPNYLLFRQQRQRTAPPSASVPSAHSTPKSSESTGSSSDRSDHSSDSHGEQLVQATSTSGAPPPPLNTTSPTSPGSAPTYGPGSSSSSRRRGTAVPDEYKDAAYWERRRKNNEAAKKSRDARRAKEDEIAIRATFLEQENHQLRIEVTTLNKQLIHLRALMEGRPIATLYKTLHPIDHTDVASPFLMSSESNLGTSLRCIPDKATRTVIGQLRRLSLVRRLDKLKKIPRQCLSTAVLLDDLDVIDMTVNPSRDLDEVQSLTILLLDVLVLDRKLARVSKTDASYPYKYVESNSENPVVIDHLSGYHHQIYGGSFLAAPAVLLASGHLDALHCDMMELAL
ncbi:protein giant-like [Tropilaelaps mercedesae]|uniref:Protein giant-like n=1 Tax=Tropilaelaps mercedesae TaxID=418985 RepID=A0A1V9X8J8_9ACAR|nr:protein giant-like [Tropilaelaps mercedesae]